MSSLLLKNGTALIHDAQNHVKPTRTDILIEGNKIVKLGEDITPEAGVEVVDCTDKIICPGFIDTHHHLWPTQLKGRHANQLLLDYMVHGNFQSSQFTPKDFFWGQLGGCLEAIAAGTTTVVDHAHLNYSPDCTRLAISATASSGLRCIFGYCPTPRPASWNPFKFHENQLEEWILELMAELAKESPFGDGRVTLGLSYDLFFLDPEVSKSVIQKARSVGIKTFTTHALENPQRPGPSFIQMIDSIGLLDSSWIFSHANGCSEKDAKLIREKDAKVSSTPSTELQMAMGSPVCFNDSLGLYPQSSLGIDCHSNNAGSIVEEMRLGLQSARNKDNEAFLAQGKVPKSVTRTVEEVFNLGTILGAKAIGMEEETGSIAEGKLADLVIFDALTPAMICGADHDPVAAVVLHSSPADIDTVIISGKIRKRDGKLVTVELDGRAGEAVGKKSLEWKDVATELVKSREEILKKIEKLDLVQAKEAIYQMWHIDESKFVDKL